MLVNAFVVIVQTAVASLASVTVHPVMKATSASMSAPAEGLAWIVRIFVIVTWIKAIVATQRLVRAFVNLVLEGPDVMRSVS